MKAPRLVVLAGPDKDKQFPLLEGVGHIMGRHQDTAYRLGDARASRFHCEIQCVDGKVTIVDQGGSGGVLVNGEKAQRQTLQVGDTLQIGESLLRLQAGADPEGETVRGVAKGAEYDPKATEELAELSGRTLARFRIGEILGMGTSSMVFKAVDGDDEKTVALKVMQPAFSRDEEEMQRFIRAMKTMMPLRHPNLVSLLGAGKSGPYCWAAMEFVEGESLTQVIQRIGIAGMLDWKLAFRVAVHVGRALEYAHDQDVIHRNISPPNVLVETSTRLAKLGDLVLAKALEGTNARQITRPGELVGAVDYMSPERTQGQTAGVDHRSDLFSLGATVYALLTGKPPFVGKTLVESVVKIRTAEPPKPSTFQMGIPSSFEGAVLKLLAKSPDERYQSAGELLQELERIGRSNGVQV